MTVPASMINEQVDKNMQQFEYQMQMNGLRLEDYAKMLGTNVETLRNTMRPDAEDQVKMRLLLEKVAETENVEVADEDVDREYDRMVEEYGMELEQIKKFVAADDIRADLKLVRAGDLIVAAAKALKPEKPAKKTTKKAEDAADDAKTEEKTPDAE